MAQQLIQLGTTPNDKTGTKLRTAGGYINANFTEVYAAKETVTVTPASDADITLTTTENLYGRIELATGSWTSAHNVVVSLTQRSFTFVNNSTYAATVKTSAGTGVAVPAGQSARLHCDGTGVVVANANGRFDTVTDTSGTGAPDAPYGIKLPSNLDLYLNDNSAVTAEWVRNLVFQTDSKFLEMLQVFASDAGSGDTFGIACALNSDGTVLAVGAALWDGPAGQNQGAVYIFDIAGAVATERITSITPSDAGSGDNFGVSCALNSDGTVLAVGSYFWDGPAGSDQGAVYLYELRR